MKKKYIIAIALVVIGILFLLPNDTPERRIDVPNYKINFKNICKFDYQGFDGEAYVNMECVIPKLEERQRKYEEYFLKNRSDLIEHHTLKEREEELVIRNEIALANSKNICKMDKNTNLSNGDVINIECRNDSLKRLNYSMSNQNFTVTVEGLEKLPVIEPIDEDNYSDRYEKPDYKTEAHIGNIGELISVQPLDIEQYEFKEDLDSEKTVLFVPEEKAEIALKIAKEKGFRGVVAGEFEYWKENGYKKENFKGVN